MLVLDAGLEPDYGRLPFCNYACLTNPAKVRNFTACEFDPIKTTLCLSVTAIDLQARSGLHKSGRKVMLHSRVELL